MYVLVFVLQLLLDFITSVGYHQNIYTLYSYPHEHVAAQPSRTLYECGLTKDCALHVDERQ